MIRYFILLINALVALFISLFISQDIELKMGVPEQVQAGEEFQVILSISKGSIESFSRYQQDLPYGLTAEKISTPNADFSFENQRVRLIWLKLPKEDQITVSYKIKVDNRLKGSFDLSAEFSYIEGNERKNITFNTPHAISIIPDPNLTADQLIDIQDFQAQTLTDLKQKYTAQNLSIIRRIPELSDSKNITVELTLNKGNLNKFAKIEEYIPNGFIANEIDSKNGIFSFENNKVKFLWVNLPDDQEFTVKYRLQSDKTIKPEDLKITGSFSYIDGDQTKTLVITREQTDDFIVTKNEERDLIIADNNEIKPEPVNEKIEKQDTITDLKEENKIIIETLTKTEGDEAFVLHPEDGIYFRVQLAAGHKPIDIPKYFKRLTIKEEVKLEFHEGWRKYTVGSFKEYKDARDYRNLVWKTSRIHDAFISAYNTGARITVQEALMISNQKWYR